MSTIKLPSLLSPKEYLAYQPSEQEIKRLLNKTELDLDFERDIKIMTRYMMTFSVEKRKMAIGIVKGFVRDSNVYQLHID